MSVLIVGGGLAGLTSALRLRMESPGACVSILEKPSPQGNSQIAGMRFRQRISGKGLDPVQEIAELLASRNGGVVTERMTLFAQLATQELDTWRTLQVDPEGKTIQYVDRPEWFGPQWGKANKAQEGRGRSVLQDLKKCAEDLGIQFLTREATGLQRQGREITGLVVRNLEGRKESLSEINAEQYVLAGGSIGGSMFESTNKVNHHSPQELGYSAGFTLWDSTIHMMHPFGNADNNGNPRVGCFGTDNIASARVYFANGEEDIETSELLSNHKAHYEFPSICRRFLENGGTVKLRLPTGECYARVSHHYSHLGIATEEGTKIKGVDNGYAIGDASGLGFWTEHKVRFPGFALTKCLVDARLLVHSLKGELTGRPLARREGGLYANSFDAYALPKELAKSLRSINTEGLFGVEFGKNKSEQESALDIWEDVLRTGVRGASESAIYKLSCATVAAYRLKIGMGVPAEPIGITHEGLYAIPLGRRL